MTYETVCGALLRGEGLSRNNNHLGVKVGRSESSSWHAEYQRLKWTRTGNEPLQEQDEEKRWGGKKLPYSLFLLLTLPDEALAQLGLCSINSPCSSQQPFLSSDSLAFSTLRKRLGEVEEQAHIELLGLGSQHRQGRTMGGTENSKSYCQSELTFIANNLDVIRPDRGMSMWIIFSVIPYS